MHVSQLLRKMTPLPTKSLTQNVLNENAHSDSGSYQWKPRDREIGLRKEASRPRQSEPCIFDQGILCGMPANV